ALLRIGNIVAKVDADLFAEDAAGGIDVIGRLLGAGLHLRAGGGVRAGDRAADAELDLGGCGARQCACEAQREAECGDPVHAVPLEVRPAGSTLLRCYVKALCGASPAPRPAR